MAFIDLLRQLLQTDENTETQNVAERGVELRESLNDDPNNVEAFNELAELVHDAARSRSVVEDPLTADIDQTPEERANLALWSLAEELSQKPSAWYPLIELGRQSLEQDHEGGVRRLTTAVERDDTGMALSEVIKVLRGAEQYDSAMAMGIGHWDPNTQAFEAGEQIVLAAIDAGRPEVARTHLDQLAASSDETERIDMLTSLIERAEQG